MRDDGIIKKVSEMERMFRKKYMDVWRRWSRQIIVTIITLPDRVRRYNVRKTIKKTSLFYPPKAGETFKEELSYKNGVLWHGGRWRLSYLLRFLKLSIIHSLFLYS